MGKLAQGGQTATALIFPITEFQRHGDVVIPSTTFRISLRATDAATRETAGPGTEVFVRRPTHNSTTGVFLQPTDLHDMTAIGDLLQAWALATRQNRSDDILRHHAVNVVIFDVLAPMQYTSASEYRASWAEWHPDTEGEAIFDLEDLVIHAGSETAFAHAFIRCGGAMPDGRAFTDHVRATFCLTKPDGHWMVVHQHVSKPMARGS